MKYLKVAILAINFISSSLCSGQDYREITKRSYDETAIEYEANNIKLQPEVKSQAFLSRLSPYSLILDLGCGPGRDAKYFVEKGHQVVGVDISSQMVAIARKSVPDAEFIVSDIESLNLESKSFDAIWASASLLHISKQAMPSVLAKIYALLKSGGVFYVSMKQGQGKHVQADHRYGGVEKFWNYIDEVELISLLTAEEFEVLEKETHGKSTSYQTHPWISVLCQKKIFARNP